MEIDPKQAILYVDEFCYDCKKRFARSMLTQHDGRFYCEPCNSIRELDKNICAADCSIAQDIATRSNKTPEMEKFCNDVAKVLFGRERKGDVCVTCGSDKVAPSDFKDNLSRKEFAISKMCQQCQDETFEED